MRKTHLVFSGLLYGPIYMSHFSSRVLTRYLAPIKRSQHLLSHADHE